MRDRGTTKRDGFVFSGSTYLDFTPIKELVITSRLGYRYTYSNSYGYVMPNITCSDLYQDYVSVSATSSSTTYWQWENFANYTKTFADKHNVNVMLGMSYSSNTSFGVTEESMVAVPATRLIWVLPSWIPIMPILLFGPVLPLVR